MDAPPPASTSTKSGSCENASSVLKRFIAVRGLTEKNQSQQGSEPTSIRLTAKFLSPKYTKRQYGERATAQRTALGQSPDDCSSSADTCRKRQHELLHIHKDEEEVDKAFLKETRALVYERESLDKVAVNREKNRLDFEKRLRRLMVEVRGLKASEEESYGTRPNSAR